MKHKAIFLDRDGTLIVDAGYPNDPEQVQLIPGAAEALLTFVNAGYLLVVISNQSGIGRGKIKPDEAQRVHQRFVELFERQGIHFSGVYYCPHAPEENCNCRKPATGLIEQAVMELDIDVKHSWMIGDKLSDVQTGLNTGMKSILFRNHPSNKEKEIQPDFQSDEWQPIVDYILNHEEVRI